jgi:putative sterol carrier protein
MPLEAETQPEWVVLGMRAIYDPEDEPVPTVYELRIDDEVFWARTDDGSLRVGRGHATEPDVVLTAGVETIARLMRGDLKPSAAVRSGAVELEGETAAFYRFPELFRFPPSP